MASASLLTSSGESRSTLDTEVYISAKYQENVTECQLFQDEPTEVIHIVLRSSLVRPMENAEYGRAVNNSDI